MWLEKGKKLCKNENAWLPYKIHFNEVSLIEHFTRASLFLFLIRSFFPNNMGPDDCMPFINESATNEKQQGKHQNRTLLGDLGTH